MGRDAVSHQTAAGADLGIINLESNTTAPPRIYDLILGSDATPADQAGEFVVNVATEAYPREIAAAAEVLPYGESEFELTGLDSAPSRRVKPHRLVASPIAFECVTLEVLRTNPGAPAAGNLVLGQVI